MTDHRVAGCIRALMAAGLCLLLIGCPMNDKSKKQDETLNNFQTMLRFSEYGGLLNFIDSDYLKENPITSLEMNRLRQYKVSSYDVRSVVADDDEQGFRQVVELKLFNLRTARERTVLYYQNWKWHDPPGVWRLHSGLPDLGSAP
ncbi:MAG: hypothetical protein KKC01_09740 [Gammaproteobacteria bacterium]|nr:hypothetical protein [Gammaproteobacteria bacterium]